MTWKFRFLGRDNDRIKPGGRGKISQATQWKWSERAPSFLPCAAQSLPYSPYFLNSVADWFSPTWHYFVSLQKAELSLSHASTVQSMENLRERVYGLSSLVSKLWVFAFTHLPAQKAEGRIIPILQRFSKLNFTYYGKLRRRSRRQFGTLVYSSTL